MLPRWLRFLGKTILVTALTLAAAFASRAVYLASQVPKVQMEDARGVDQPSANCPPPLWNKAPAYDYGRDGRSDKAPGCYES